ncbi:MAG: glycosyltransferase family 1 protein [Micavibrio sp.]|nr:glycosyltransferase family 1 protein [Micavibrio sp.]
MKILIISDAWHPQLNGVVRTYEYLAEELVKEGHEVRVIGPADFPFKIPMLGYAEIELVIGAYGRLAKMIDAEKPQHIHIATEGPLGLAGRRYCVKRKIPFTTSYHTQFPDHVAKRFGHYVPFLHGPTHFLAKRFVRWFHAPAGAVLVATPSLEAQLQDWGFKVPLLRFSRGVNLDLFFPGEKTLFSNLKKPVALYVGRIAIEKNLEDFLSMDWPGSKVLVGDGPSLPFLKNKYPDVHFAGKKTGAELAECYRSADLFVFPSRTDTFGIVLVEALASGLPVAAYDVTGPKDIVTDSSLGALHDSDLGLAAREALKNGNAQARSHHVKHNYTWENAARQFLGAIENYCV